MWLRSMGGVAKPYKEANPLIPTMTSNNTPSGYLAIASGCEYSTARAIYFAYDRRLDNGGWGTSPSQSGDWIGIKFPTKTNVKYISVTNLSVDREIRTGIVQGSDDGTTWFDISNFSNSESSRYGKWGIDLPQNEAEYFYYRIYILTFGNYAEVGEIQMYDANPNVYLYKDGVQTIAWDNTGYTLYSNYTNDGGFTLLETCAQSPSVSSVHSRCMITDSPVDVSDYNLLKIQYNGSKIYTLDISSINASAYISVFFYNSSVDTYIISLLNSTKEGIGTNPYISVDNWVQTSNLDVNRVWLEK